jgi:hypothetical protein
VTGWPSYAPRHRVPATVSNRRGTPLCSSSRRNNSDVSPKSSIHLSVLVCAIPTSNSIYNLYFARNIIQYTCMRSFNVTQSQDGRCRICSTFQLLSLISRVNHIWYSDYATGYSVSIPGRGIRIFTPPQRPHQLWGPASFLSNGYRGLFPPL